VTCTRNANNGYILLIEHDDEAGHVVTTDASGGPRILRDAVMTHLLYDLRQVHPSVQSLRHEITRVLVGQAVPYAVARQQEEAVGGLDVRYRDVRICRNHLIFPGQVFQLLVLQIP